jgi:hypothetical protein
MYECSKIIKDMGFEYKELEDKSENQIVMTATESAELEDDTGVEYKLLVVEPNDIDVQRMRYRFDSSNAQILIFLVITAIEFWLIHLIDSLQWMDSIKHTEQHPSITGLFLMSLAFWFDILVSLLWGFFVYKLAAGQNNSNKPRIMLWAAIAAEQLTLLQSYVWYVVMFSEGDYNGTAMASDAIQVALSMTVVIALINDTNLAIPIEPSHSHSATQV